MRRIEELESRRLLALTAEMVADLTTSNPKSADIREITVFREHVYFLASDGLSEHALWRSDGTPEGTSIFRDFRQPGYAADIAELTVVGDTLYFHAFAGADVGTELWKTDGTLAGTQLVKDIFPGPAPSRPYLLTAADGILYFFCRHNAPEQVELWKSDGSEDGTQLVQSFSVGFLQGREPSDLRFVNGQVFFEIDNDLWVTDGTNVGTSLLKEFPDLPYFENNPPRNFGDLGGKLYFFAKDEEHGRELWSSDGTSEGTLLVRDLNPGVYDSYSYRAAVITTPNRLFFQANQPGAASQLWSSDGSFEGTNPIEGAPSGQLTNITPFGERVLLHGTPADDWRQHLFVSDGSSEGTFQLGEIESNGGIEVDGPVAHFLGSNEGKPELWSTDGSVAGTAVVNTAEWLSVPRSIGNGIYFGIAFDSVTGHEPWTWDGTAEGASLLRDFRPGNDGSLLQLLRNVGDELLFSRTDPTLGPQLWVTDDSPLGVTQLPARPFAASSSVASGELTYFVVNDGGIAGTELWRTDGSFDGTFRLTDLLPGPANTTFGELEAAPGGIYFVATTAELGSEVYFTDGTVAGTRLLKDVRAGRNGSSASELTMVGDQLYFAADDGVNGYELWTSDGTAEGTRLVKLIQQPNAFNTSRFKNFTAFQGLLYFAADDELLNNQLWRSDGTEAGTYMVAQLTPRPSDAALGNFQVVGDALLFTAQVSPFGSELWTTDGTADGTRLVKDVTPGPEYNQKQFFGVVNGKLLFAVRRQISTFDFDLVLWRSDGTEEGTVPFFDLATTGANSNQTRFAWTSSQLFFTAGPGVAGKDLWMTDGTAEQTTRALSFQTNGVGVSVTSPPIVAGNRLYFIGDDGFYGTELWRTVHTPGDTNFDGDVDLVDLNNVRNHFGYEGDEYPGDTNNDNIVDLDDLNAVRNNFGASSSSSRSVTPPSYSPQVSASQPRSTPLISPAGIDAVLHLMATEPLRTKRLQRGIAK